VFYSPRVELSDAADLNASVAGSDGGRAASGGLSHQQAAALNYSTLVGAAAAAAGGVVDPGSNISSTETLLRNIQGLLKVAADNARQQERQINYEKGRNTLKNWWQNLISLFKKIALS
jgi:hypothetical protein